MEQVDERVWGSAWKEYSQKHKLSNIPSREHLQSYLATLNIHLSEKACDSLIVMAKQAAGISYVHVNGVIRVFKNALQSYQGLPIDQAIGGAIVEFNASAAGRLHRNQQSMASMQAIVAASTTSLSHYARVKETPQEREARRRQEKLQRQLKREKMEAKKHGGGMITITPTPTHEEKDAASATEDDDDDDDDGDNDGDDDDEIETPKPSPGTPEQAGPFTHETKRHYYARLLREQAEQERQQREREEQQKQAHAADTLGVYDRDDDIDTDTERDSPHTQRSTMVMHATPINDTLSSNGNGKRKSFLRSPFADADGTPNATTTTMTNAVAAMTGPTGVNGVPVEMMEVLQHQQNQLFRIQTQMDALYRHIKQLDASALSDDLNSEMNECLIELRYLQSSTLSRIENEVNELKSELTDNLESLSIAAAHNVSREITHDLHFMNSKIDRSVRILSSDWNTSKRVLRNQQRLDACLMRAEKVIRKYQELQSELRHIASTTQHTMMQVGAPQFMAEMDTIRSSLKSMDHYLNTFVFDRLSRVENAVMRIFEHGVTLHDGSAENNRSNMNGDGGDGDEAGGAGAEEEMKSSAIKRFSVDELMNQLDAQRLNFEGELRRQNERISHQKEEMEQMREAMQKEKDVLQRDKETYADLKVKFDTQCTANKRLEMDLQTMKRQLERERFMHNDVIGDGNGNGNTNGSGGSGADDDDADDDDDDKPIHPQITAVTATVDKDSRRTVDVPKNVDLSLEFERYYSNSLSALIGDFISRAKLENKTKADEYHASKEGGHLQFASKDELPKFLATRGIRDAQQQELEERLGFGYDELFYLYRENTEINLRCLRLAHEKDALHQALRDVQYVMVMDHAHFEEIPRIIQAKIEKEYAQQHRVRTATRLQELEHEKLEQELRLLDRYRLEALNDAKKVEQEIASKINYDKFQFHRQRKKMNALMKSEKDGVLKEREIMEQERAEIEEQRAEWQSKLDELEKREEEFDQQVEIAKENMNEAVFQKGVAEYMELHKNELMEDLRAKVEVEMIREESGAIREECETQIEAIRSYQNQRYEVATQKMAEQLREIDSLKLQNKNLTQRLAAKETQQQVPMTMFNELQGRYDEQEKEFVELKRKFSELQLQKYEAKEEEIEKAARTKMKASKHSAKNGGQLAWLDEDEADDDVTKNEKRAIRAWLMTRHGKPEHFESNKHWLALPEDVVAAKEEDIKQLQAMIATLKAELDAKTLAYGKLDAQHEALKHEKSNHHENELIAKLRLKNKTTADSFTKCSETVTKYLKIWDDRIKTVTKAEHKWVMKYHELTEKEKALQKEREDLIYDQRMWYAHKNHILRAFFYFTKQVWWERYMVHEFQKARTDLEVDYYRKLYPEQKVPHHFDLPLFNQIFKMQCEAWFECGVYQHALTRWFCQYDTYSKEKEQFYFGDGDNNEELYIFNDDVVSQIESHFDSVIERYYKMKMLKRRTKFARYFIIAEQPELKIDPSLPKFKTHVKSLMHLLNQREPGYFNVDMKKLVARVAKEMDDKMAAWHRVNWDACKTIDGVGMVPTAQQQQRRKEYHHEMKRRRQSRKSKGNMSDAAMTALAELDESKDDDAKDGAGGSAGAGAGGSGSGKRDSKKARFVPGSIVTSSGGGGGGKVIPGHHLKTKAQLAKERDTLTTPKAGPKNHASQKTWSNAMANFKSVNKKKQIKKLSPEERKQVMAKAKASKEEHSSSSRGTDTPTSASVHAGTPSMIIPTKKATKAYKHKAFKSNAAELPINLSAQLNLPTVTQGSDEDEDDADQM